MSVELGEAVDCARILQLEPTRFTERLDMEWEKKKNQALLWGLFVCLLLLPTTKTGWLLEGIVFGKVWLEWVQGRVEEKDWHQLADDYFKEFCVTSWKEMHQQWEAGQSEEKFTDTEEGRMAEKVSLNMWEGTELSAHWPAETELGTWTVLPQWEEEKWVCGYRCPWAGWCDGERGRELFLIAAML